jgi:hypothetical protein
LGQLWGYFCVTLGSVWGQFGVTFKLVWCRCRKDVAPILGSIRACRSYEADHPMRRSVPELLHNDPVRSYDVRRSATHRILEKQQGDASSHHAKGVQLSPMGFIAFHGICGFCLAEGDLKPILSVLALCPPQPLPRRGFKSFEGDLKPNISVGEAPPPPHSRRLWVEV